MKAREPLRSELPQNPVWLETSECDLVIPLFPTGSTMCGDAI